MVAVTIEIGNMKHPQRLAIHNGEMPHLCSQRVGDPAATHFRYAIFETNMLVYVGKDKPETSAIICL